LQATISLVCSSPVLAENATRYLWRCCSRRCRSVRSSSSGIALRRAFDVAGAAAVACSTGPELIWRLCSNALLCACLLNVLDHAPICPMCEPLAQLSFSRSPRCAHAVRSSLGGFVLLGGVSFGKRVGDNGWNLCLLLLLYIPRSNRFHNGCLAECICASSGRFQGRCSRKT
jgi:hypothetical protein